ncbi:TPA: translation initiation factor IF-2 [Candidatus Collierbacteria bacterium]|uniref:Translation initiation factor IF-2 n=1 Tax=Candidatus Collierbacteria bacterium GW2011_GWB2_44_22 TaxID=1618387 RepID=A0A0G1KWP6_9BACT|nr:MAG: Translation initiation factor IF-2 [Candidatus Collierbacteria bacterium GW2011_GWA2_44_13]KKT52359.1 MAG: Translation initiation factor IF-2 [Candidatus Collierbacteria bacterium GW2011_GWB2_44_22]KKT62023.1 MAG: Translation initiation factor IF-2 [Candidatus Collierbacteria bacterium GW2011_GWD1_44_27]KKT64425.1 MAG: Translation initiation factor IF-2 [Candidatus Collierbacteria bacterium GW2011_GWC2_44_30]KKT69261.1 MAG: Translation initiation factor IF-2 [Microgenomates group bacter
MPENIKDTLPAEVGRPPVVTILGHVDHGKTSLLDRIRKAKVAAGEIGGITQAIGAYQIEYKGKKVTFIDTPGHAAFSAMRRRGGQAADVAILLVAADDSVMPQTIESIEHIKSAGIPFVVAVNKVDLPGINPDRVKTDLANNGVYVEGYGGNIPLVNISAKTGTGVDDLLEIILLLAELEELKDSSAESPATVLVIESSLHPQIGPLATLLVKRGIFRKNDNLFLLKKNIGKIRSMIDYTGKTLLEATPSTPFQVIGLSVVPIVGDLLTSTPILSSVGAIHESPDISPGVAIPVQTSSLRGAEDDATTPNSEKPTILLKADVQGSLEAILGSIKDQANVIYSSVGNVSDADIQTASSSKAEILGFNIHISSSVAKLAEIEKIKFSNFRIIYQLFDYIKDLQEKKTIAQGPKIIETGQATILKVFNFGGTIVYGCVVISGKIKITDKIQNSRISSLQANKSEVSEVKKDQEFGITLIPPIEFKPGDIMTATTIEVLPASKQA